MQYYEIFNEPRQRATAFQYWKQLYGDTADYGKLDEWEYLEQAYSFLFCSATREFLEFCAKKEGLAFSDYCLSIDVDAEKC